MTDIVPADMGGYAILGKKAAEAFVPDAVKAFMQQHGSALSLVVSNSTRSEYMEKARDEVKKPHKQGANLTVLITAKNRGSFKGKENNYYTCTVAKLEHSSPIKKDQNGVDAVAIPTDVTIFPEIEPAILLHYLNALKKKESSLPDFILHALGDYELDMKYLPPYKMGKEALTVVAPEMVKQENEPSPLITENNRKILFDKCEAKAREILETNPLWIEAVKGFIAYYKDVPEYVWAYPGNFVEIKSEVEHDFEIGSFMKFVDLIMLITITVKVGTKTKITHTLKHTDAVLGASVPPSLLREVMHGSHYTRKIQLPFGSQANQMHAEFQTVASKVMTTIKVRPFDPSVIYTNIRYANDNYIYFKTEGFDADGWTATPKDQRNATNPNKKLAAKKGLIGFQWRKPLAQIVDGKYVLTDAVDDLENNTEIIAIDCALWQESLKVFGIENWESWAKLAPLIMKNFDGLMLAEMDEAKTDESNKNYASLHNKELQKTAYLFEETKIEKDDTPEEVFSKRHKRLQSCFLQRRFHDKYFVFNVKSVLVDAKKVIKSSGFKVDLQGVYTALGVEDKDQKNYTTKGKKKASDGDDIILLNDSFIKISTLSKDKYEFVIVGDWKVTGGSDLVKDVEEKFVGNYFRKDYDSDNESMLNAFYARYKIDDNANFRKVKIAKGKFHYVFALKKDEEIDNDAKIEAYNNFVKYLGPAQSSDTNSGGNNTNTKGAIEQESKMTVEEVKEHSMELTEQELQEIEMWNMSNVDDDQQQEQESEANKEGEEGEEKPRNKHAAKRKNRTPSVTSIDAEDEDANDARPAKKQKK